MRLGVAISVYNKLDELATSVEIIRKHWASHNDAFISVCCNDPSSIDRVRLLAVDSVVEGEHIPSTPKPNLRRRQFDCIRKSVTACDADYIVHWHADAYATRVGPLLDLIDQMEESKAIVAFRGRGIDYRNPKTVFGDVDDHFIIWARQAVPLLDVDPTEFVQYCNVESFLSRILTPHRNSTIHYSTMAENLVGVDQRDDFYPDGLLHRTMNPFNIDPVRGFVHAQTRDLIREKLLEYGVPRDLIKL